MQSQSPAPCIKNYYKLINLNTTPSQTYTSFEQETNPSLMIEKLQTQGVESKFLLSKHMLKLQ